MQSRSASLLFVACAALVACATLAACGPDTASSDCQPACAGKECGDDGCGGSCGACLAGATCTAGACVTVAPACVPACAGKPCGDDGCGGSCGSCPSTATCTALGTCQATAPSPGCPLGGTCTYLERIAWNHACTSATDCTRTSAISTYGTFEACQTFGCMGGNSRCGDQFGNPSDSERWSCEACKVSCSEGAPTACGAAHETAQGCWLADSTWGAYLADCICQ